MLTPSACNEGRVNAYRWPLDLRLREVPGDKRPAWVGPASTKYEGITIRIPAPSVRCVPLGRPEDPNSPDRRAKGTQNAAMDPRCVFGRPGHHQVRNESSTLAAEFFGFFEKIPAFEKGADGDEHFDAIGL